MTCVNQRSNDVSTVIHSPRTRRVLFSALITLALVVAATPGECIAQPDLSVFGERMAGENMYGIGGSLIVPLAAYRFDVVAGGNYFFAPSDTSSAWTVNFDANMNLFSWRFLRPYAGAGLNYFNRDGDRVGINLEPVERFP